MFLRDGQWCKWTGHVPGAAVAKDGKIVGIHCKAGVDPRGIAKQAKLVPVDNEGLNVYLTIGGEMAQVFLAVNQPGLEPILDRDDIPAKRLESNPEWKPRP